jgi:hypothetical protein
MMANLFRLSALVALVLMPFGMAAAPAVAQSHLQGIADGLCADPPGPLNDPLPKSGECIMSCVLVMPDITPSGFIMIQVARPLRPRAVCAHGLEPEITTPPPKLS